jgi:type II pantothenate kinase
MGTSSAEPAGAAASPASRAASHSLGGSGDTSATDAAAILGLSAQATAAAGGYEARDISRALLIMISNNIGQLAYLNAVKHRCKHVYFAGNFLRHENTIAMRTLAYAINFWSQGAMEGLFLRHEGYCGALGAFLNTLESAEDV